MIAKAVKGWIKKTYNRKLILHRRKYEWAYDGGIIRNDETTMLYFTFKRINLDTRIFVLNLKFENDKGTLSKFLNN